MLKTNKISRQLLSLTFAGALGAGVGIARAQESFTAQLNGSYQLGADLQPTASDWTLNASGASVNDDQRSYLRTTASDFNDYDFTATLLYTVGSTSGGDPIAFFGLGEGEPNGNAYGEPELSVYLRSSPNGFNSGEVDMNINSDPTTGSSTFDAQSGTGFGSGQHQAQITKLGDTVTLSVDNSPTGPFVAGFSESFSLSADLNFLNAANSYIFFGSQAASTTFQRLTVTSVPEPPALALAVAGGLGAFVLLRRRR